MSVVRMDNVRFWPGASVTPALDDVTLRIAAGQIVLLRGPSGSGKSTLLRAIAGLVPHFHGGTFQGRVLVDGLDTRRTPVGDLGRTVGSVFQDPETQAVRTTVASDVTFGLENAAVPAARIDAEVARALELTDAVHLAGRRIATLSGGERQRAAIAAAIATRPRVLLMDEPTSQLDDAATGHLMATLRRLAADGTAVMVAEHHVERLDLRPDRTVFMSEGRIVTDMIDDEPPAPEPVEGGAIRVDVTGLDAAHDDRPVLRGCSLSVRAGRVVALWGPNGGGKSTLLRAIAGLHPITAGRIVIDGEDVTGTGAEERTERVAFLPQDAGRRLLRDRVRDEVVDGAAPRETDAAVLMERFGIGHLADRHPLDCSVGERERIAIANVVGRRAPVLLLDEPSRGMDPGHRNTLAARVRAEAADGRAVMVATHDPVFLRAVADEVIVVRDGSVRVRRTEEVVA